MEKLSYEELRNLTEKLYEQIIAICDINIAMCDDIISEENEDD